ncbi:HNH endonuclease signature motif containing protein [Herbiconiux ginsengi]|uniref:HNH nuclease domain-containing protein n=1 Tax=Herbiconiux ginsengi TaxID=381665 RepID=A0A1H3KJD2_9MICO|nr:HNH endonuclease signature motif containing protein [Herbiconiux ginsengi]SDY52311.1 protein of unknown function [Herbiconiux ginsengi]
MTSTAPLLTSLDDAGLLARAAEIERAGRLIDAERVAVAGEIGHRSRSSLGDEGLSRSENFVSPVKLLAEVTGVSSREAKSRLDLGRRLRAAELLGGLPGPEPFPAVTAALAAGLLPVEAASVITRECIVLAERGVAEASIAEAERALVDAAVGRSGSDGAGRDAGESDVVGGGFAGPEGAVHELTMLGRGAGAVVLGVDDVARLAIRVRELLDPDGAAPRDERHQQLRSLTLTRSADGMFRGRLALTPEQGALWVNATQAILSPRVQPRFRSEDDYVSAQLTADTRTGPQRLADAVTELIARAAGAPEMPHLAGATTTVNVHVSLADLESGQGRAWIDGIDEPVPLGVVERLRCHAPTVATLFGDHGEVLHHGKTRRLFTPAQNRALAARDGGCVWPGCDRPPSWCESHHVEEWRSPAHAPGRTDIGNGVLLCHFHHAHLHSATWALVMRAGVPHVIPPRRCDPEQRPIPTTRRRTTLARSQGATPARRSNAPPGA